MEEKTIKTLLRSRYRIEMWRNSNKVFRKIRKTLPISSAYLLGSFTTKKRRPADVDFIILLKTPDRDKKSQWSVDLVIAPDNEFGDSVLADAKKWMKQKYGSRKSAVIRLK